MAMRKLAAVAALLLTWALLSGCTAARLAQKNDPPTVKADVSVIPPLTKLPPGVTPTCSLQVRTINGAMTLPTAEAELGRRCPVDNGKPVAYAIHVSAPKITRNKDPALTGAYSLAAIPTAIALGGMAGGAIGQSPEAIVLGAIIGGVAATADYFGGQAFAPVLYQLEAQVEITERIPKKVSKPTSGNSKGKPAQSSVVWEQGRIHQTRVLVSVEGINLEEKAALGLIEKKLGETLANFF